MEKTLQKHTLKITFGFALLVIGFIITWSFKAGAFIANDKANNVVSAEKIETNTVNIATTNAQMKEMSETVTITARDVKRLVDDRKNNK